MENPRQYIDNVTAHIKEKAPAYALAAAVALGSLALIGEGNGQNPSGVTDGDEPNPTLGMPAATAAPFDTHDFAAGDLPQ